MRRPSSATPARNSGRSAIFRPGARCSLPASGAATRKPATSASGATGTCSACPAQVAAAVRSTARASPGSQVGAVFAALGAVRWVTIRSCRSRMRRLPEVWKANGKRPCRKQASAPSAIEPAKLDAWPRCSK